MHNQFLSFSVNFNPSHESSLFIFPICITENFSKLRGLCQSCDHLNILIRSSRSFSSPPPLYRAFSSENLEICDTIPASMSFDKTMKSSDLITDPCGTSLYTVVQLENLIRMPTFCLLPERHLWANLKTCSPLFPHVCNFLATLLEVHCRMPF